MFSQHKTSVWVGIRSVTDVLLNVLIWLLVPSEPTALGREISFARGCLGRCPALTSEHKQGLSSGPQASTELIIVWTIRPEPPDCKQITHNSKNNWTFHAKYNAIRVRMWWQQTQSVLPSHQLSLRLPPLPNYSEQLTWSMSLDYGCHDILTEGNTPYHFRTVWRTQTCITRSLGQFYFMKSDHIVNVKHFRATVRPADHTRIIPNTPIFTLKNWQSSLHQSLF